MDEDDLRTLVREFKASVVIELADTNRRIAEQGVELRQRITMVENGLHNAIRDAARDTDMRIGHLENRTQEVEVRLTGVESGLAGVHGLVRQVLDRLDDRP